MPCGRGLPETFRWQAEVDPDELEYVLHALCNLDAELSDEARQSEGPGIPAEGRTFYLVLVSALLHALEAESLTRAAFVDHLGSFWPTAAEAN